MCSSECLDIMGLVSQVKDSPILRLNNWKMEEISTFSSRSCDWKDHCSTPYCLGGEWKWTLCAILRFFQLRMEEDNGGDKKCDGFLTFTCSQTFLWICDVFENPLMEQQLGNRSCNLFSIFQTPFAVQMMGMWALSLVELWRNSGNIKPTSSFD